MENCNKRVQYETYEKLSRAASPKMIVEVPCAMGGHAGMMDAHGLVGHHETWEGMVHYAAKFMQQVFR